MIELRGVKDFGYNDFFSEQVLKYTFFCNDSGIDSLFVFLYLFLFFVSRQKKEKDIKNEYEPIHE